MIIVGELSQRQPVCPVILVVAHKNPEVGLNLLVYSLCLPVHLRVVCSGGAESDVKEPRQFLREVRYESTPSIADDSLRKSMVPPDMLKEQACNSCGIDCGNSR